MGVGDKETLDEEKETDAKLTERAESTANEEAAGSRHAPAKDANCRRSWHPVGLMRASLKNT
jgi:hypothetical protein